MINNLIMIDRNEKPWFL